MNEEYSQPVELDLLAYDGQETHDNLHSISNYLSSPTLVV